MITVKQLKEMLADKDDSMLVAVNCQISEDQDGAHRARVYTKDNAPYAKADNVWDMYDVADDKPILFIE